MTLTIDLPPEKEAAFKAEAQSRGLSIEQWLLDNTYSPPAQWHTSREPILKSGPGISTPGSTATIPTRQYSPTKR